MGKIIRWITTIIMYLKGYEVIKCYNCEKEIFVHITDTNYTCGDCDYVSKHYMSKGI